MVSKETCAFLALVRAGLWGKEVKIPKNVEVDYRVIYQLSQEQSVVGLVAAGIEHATGIKTSKENVLLFVGEALQLEQRNMAMNAFVDDLFEKLKKECIYAVLVKGQGIAQCYERPLWRACGDVDLFLDETNYERAKKYLSTIAQSVEEENPKSQHLAMTIDSWIVELHGTLNRGVSKRVDNGLDKLKKRVFEEGAVRTWKNGKTQVSLPSVDNDVIVVFTHILRHFFYGGIGLRQICDWCRLLWTYRKEVNVKLMGEWLQDMKLMSEWKTFAALAVVYLGMPEETIPFCSCSSKWKRKAQKVLSIMMETGNFGHNRDVSYYRNHSFVVYKAISLWRNTWDSMRHVIIFPVDAMRVWWLRLGEGICVAAKGK